MENLDGTVIATALPQMAISFKENPVDLNMGMTAYLFSLAVFIPLSGWISDRFGARRIFAAAIFLFTVASILCGFSQSLLQFTLARVLQGFGGAMMVPVGRAVVLRATTKQDLLRSIAYLTWPALFGPLVGPPIGGLITTYASWHWIFFLNVPLGITALILALRMIPPIPGEANGRFDLVGFCLCGIASVCLLYGLEIIGQPTHGWQVVVGLLATSVVSGMLMILHLRRVAKPLFDLSVFHYRTFQVTMFGGGVFRMAVGSTGFLLPQLFQVGFGYDAAQSGFLLLAIFAGNLGMKPATTFMLRRFGLRNVLLGNGVLCACSLWACLALQATTPVPVIMAILFAGGLFRSMQFTCLNTLAFTDVPQELTGPANVLFSLGRQLNIGVGIALAALSLRVSSLWTGTAPFAEQHAPTPIDFQITFGLMGAIVLLSTLDSLRLAPDAGEEVTGHKRSAE
ncbi:MAG: MFS transporter [Planctomyces sp.]|nr:MFS transporter [Planctomyces sp.]